MPTIFTDCNDCVHLDWFNINHKMNINHKNNLEILKLLQIITLYKLPTEIGIKIIKQKNDLELKKCGTCNGVLCPKHYNNGLIYGIKYLNKHNFSICNNCCWLNNS